MPSEELEVQDGMWLRWHSIELYHFGWDQHETDPVEDRDNRAYRQEQLGIHFPVP